MPAYKKTVVELGQTVTVSIPHSQWSVRRGVAGKLRRVQVWNDERARVFNEDGTVIGRPVPHWQAGVYRDADASGHTTLWADVYVLPPRSTDPYPPPGPYQWDESGRLTASLGCACGQRVVCRHCREELIGLPTLDRREWRYVTFRTATYYCRPDGPRTRSATWHTPVKQCLPGDPGHPAIPGPDCCGMPMAAWPDAWTCRAEREHARPYLLPSEQSPKDDKADEVDGKDGQ